MQGRGVVSDSKNWEQRGKQNISARRCVSLQSHTRVCMRVSVGERESTERTSPLGRCCNSNGSESGEGEHSVAPLAELVVGAEHWPRRWAPPLGERAPREEKIAPRGGERREPGVMECGRSTRRGDAPTVHTRIFVCLRERRRRKGVRGRKRSYVVWSPVEK